MKRSEILLSTTLILGLAGGSLYAGLRGTEFWPFSAVKMYSRIDRSHDLYWCGIYGVERAADGKAYVEHYISKQDYFWPLTDLKLCIGLRRQRTRGDEALEQLWEWYEQRRLAGRHHGPRYEGLRAYTIFWKGDLDASNVHTPLRLRRIGEYLSGG